MHIHFGIIRDQKYNSQIDAIHESAKVPTRVGWSDKYSLILNERFQVRVPLHTKSLLLGSTWSANPDSGVSDTMKPKKKKKNCKGNIRRRGI